MLMRHVRVIITYHDTELFPPSSTDRVPQRSCNGILNNEISFYRKYLERVNIEIGKFSLSIVFKGGKGEVGNLHDFAWLFVSFSKIYTCKLQFQLPKFSFLFNF